MAPLDGYVFPNELHVTWTVMIVLYPYITGMVAGAFIVSSFYHVCGMEKLRPIAKYALVSSFAFLLFATVPLLNHLGRPERALNILITPNFTSAMSGFGFIYLIYTLIVFLEIWFSYRTTFIEKYNQARGIARFLYGLLLFRQTHVNEHTEAWDHKMVVVLGGIGIPGFLEGFFVVNRWCFEKENAIIIDVFYENCAVFHQRNHCQ